MESAPSRAAEIAYITAYPAIGYAVIWLPWAERACARPRRGGCLIDYTLAAAMPAPRERADNIFALPDQRRLATTCDFVCGRRPVSLYL